MPGRHTPPDVSLPFSSVYPHLHPAIGSHAHQTRLRALHLLSSRLISHDPDVGVDADSGADGVDEVVKRCLAGEEVPIDAQGVRERVVRRGAMSSSTSSSGRGMLLTTGGVASPRTAAAPRARLAG